MLSSGFIKNLNFVLNVLMETEISQRVLVHL